MEVRSGETSARSQPMEYGREGSQCGVSEGNVVGKCRIRGKRVWDGFAPEFVDNLLIAYVIFISGWGRIKQV